tara:strand:+ start:447 stop:665 length:219 start_codon:yes stop_codon:yes gene_type:complete
LEHYPLTLKILHDYGITDNSDAMRVEMLAMTIANEKHTIESLKKTSGYLSTINDINFSDEYLQKLIERQHGK